MVEWKRWQKLFFKEEDVETLIRVACFLTLWILSLIALAFIYFLALIVDVFLLVIALGTGDRPFLYGIPIAYHQTGGIGIFQGKRLRMDWENGTSENPLVSWAEASQR